ncbi:hypothetical protein P154DRAFT_417443, partial [Amniculicola lignicola CBS 123094]
MGLPSDEEDNQGWKLYLTSLIMILYAGLFVVVRVLARFYTVKWGTGDYALLVSLVRPHPEQWQLVSVSDTAQRARKHRRCDLSVQDLRTRLKFFWIPKTPYKIVVCLSKTSVIL